ncbi:RNA polymerase sigma factor [Ignavibacteria bacterium]|nr:sigma-70 family RNA polymerase sigma factor [Bacteroidota bacterium]MCZ2132856.1 sigma-70 family RNA polymerase sigma factor [Bacteroidota bacterium]
MTQQALVMKEDFSLVREYINGDSERAAGAFVRRYKSFVYSTALRHLKSRDDADDAAQEVFIRALKNLSGFKGDSSVQTWLYRITMNVCANMRRKKRLLSFFSFGDGEEGREVEDKSTVNPYETVENSDFMKHFNKMLDELPEKQRETFVLRYFHELSYEEISTALGTSIGGLKANYFHAVKKLGEMLKNSEFLAGEKYG